MPHYTTGEIARLCGVTVRTVQYYDKRGILMPEALSDGGRRLYGEDDVRKLRIICFLRDIGLSIDSIAELLQEEHPDRVIDLLLQQQRVQLESEIRMRTAQLAVLEGMEREIRAMDSFSVESIQDIARIMKDRKNLWRIRGLMIAVGLVMDAVEIAAILLWIVKGIWLPFALGMPLVIALGIFIVRYYMDRTAFICPHCHAVFRPTRKENLFAPHTPRTRKLTCTACGHHGYCVEIYQGAEK